jgi:hypothetical protein
MIVRRNMRCFVMASKHVNDIQAIARQSPIATMEKLLETVFSVGPTLRQYGENPRLAE